LLKVAAIVILSAIMDRSVPLHLNLLFTQTKYIHAYRQPLPYIITVKIAIETKTVQPVYFASLTFVPVLPIWITIANII